ncbi:MAG: amidohydrolase [Phycisphaerae bacterium]|nr:amidohydrolase [Phycisphaerae bacterium]
MNRIAALIDETLPSLIALRHDIHAHPELGFEERETARRVLEQIQPLSNLNIRTGVAKTGIVATLNADKPGRCVALRAEMDGLPIPEETGLPYASKHAGRMHACGHDGHISCLVGAAKVLSRMAGELPGKVKFIFQPAEEGGGGGKAMCDEGVLDDPKVDAVFALHGWPDLDFGIVGTRTGSVLASQDSWSITIHGVGGHAAWPHQGVDPIVAASHMVTAMQSIASRMTDPLDSVVVTVGEFHAGTTSNVIPNRADLTGTIRALNAATRAKAAARLEQIAKQTVAAFGARAEVHLRQGYPVLTNHSDASRLVAEVARDVLGPDSVLDDLPPCMGAEDFAFYAERIPAAFWCLGVRRGEACSQPRLHQPTYDFPDAALPIGIRMHCEVARRFLSEA